MLVSVVIPAVSWDELLEHTLGTLSAQVLPRGVELETTVALAGRPPDVLPPHTRVVPNPGRSIPLGLNRAIAASRGDVVVRVDARCDLAPDHVARVIDVLADETVGAVGSAQLVLDRGIFGSAYAVAFNSPLLGPSTYRYGRRSGLVDSAYLGAWRRSELDALGGFDTRLRRNQDNELADRVRGLGLGVWYDASSVVGYRSTRGLRATMAHHGDFGAWRMVQHGHGQRALTTRHVAALAVVAAGGSLGIAAVASSRTRSLALGVGLFTYTAAALGATFSARRLRRCRPDIPEPALNPLGAALAPGIAMAINGAWVAGMVRGAIRSASNRPTDGQATSLPFVDDVGLRTDSNTSSQASSTTGHEDASAT